MKRNKLLFYASIATSAFATSAIAQTAATNAVGDWDDSASWVGGTPPAAAADVALIRNGTQIIDIDSDTGIVEISRVTLGQSASTATINIQSGGSLSIINGGGTGQGQFRLGGGGAAGTTATLNVESGGTFSTVSFQTTNSTNAADVSILNLNGGAFSATAFTFGTTSVAATLNINAAGGSFNVLNTTTFGDTSTLAFALDGTGAASTTALSSGILTVGTGSILSIDLGNYIYSGSGTDTITLASATTDFTSGFDLGNISFTNDSGFTTSIDQTLGAGGSIILNVSAIPEPGAYALLAGFAGMLFVMSRRRHV